MVFLVLYAMVNYYEKLKNQAGITHFFATFIFGNVCGFDSWQKILHFIYLISRFSPTL